MGRRPKAPERRLSDYLNVSCTKTQRQSYEWAAQAAGCNSDAEWAREVLDAAVERLKKKHKPE